MLTKHLAIATVLLRRRNPVRGHWLLAIAKAVVLIKKTVRTDLVEACHELVELCECGSTA